MSRLAAVPMRVRITLAFVVATGCLFGALGVFLHARLRHEIDASVQAALRTRAGDLVARVRDLPQASVADNRLVEPGDDLVQVLARNGHIISAAPGVEHVALLARAQLARATRGAHLIPHTRIAGVENAVALVAAPVGNRVVVVGADLESRDAALHSLDRLLAIGVPGGLLLASMVGYLVAGAALGPVERMRRTAASIEAGDLSERLPLPRAQDELRRLAQTLNLMLGRVEAAFARERAFVADASHELRSPLARLRAELELAGHDGRSRVELRSAIESAAGEVDLLTRLADDLLVLARADRGRLPVRPEPVDVGVLLHRAARRAGHAHVGVDVDSGLVVAADPLRVQQAIDNLLDNALRHGGVPVGLSARGSSRGVLIHAVDHGPGFPEDLRGRAFDRFTRGNGARGDAGAGLGLSIVALVAAAHGGEVGIERRTDGTTDVWMSLPR